MKEQSIRFVSSLTPGITPHDLSSRTESLPSNLAASAASPQASKAGKPNLPADSYLDSQHEFAQLQVSGFCLSLWEDLLLSSWRPSS